MVKRVLVGAHYGIKDFLIQRLSAVLMIVYTLILLLILFNLPNSHDGWRQLFASMSMKLFTSVTLLGFFWHAWIGVRDILMDYLWKFSIRLTFMTLAALFIAANLIWAFDIVWSVK